jgi:hypothetical protein
MKRDMELIRKILFAVEAAPDRSAAWDLTVRGHTEDQVRHHCWLAMKAGLAKGSDVSSISSPNPAACLTALTWEGHDFLEHARNDTHWNRAIDSIMSSGGALTIEILKAVLSKIAMQAAGL